MRMLEGIDITKSLIENLNETTLVEADEEETEADENKIETTEVSEEDKNSIEFLKSVMQNMINASGTTELEKAVLEDQLDEVDGYDTPADFIEHLTDLGISGGGVSSMIYYDDTLAFCEEYEEEINQMLADGINEFGSLKDMFGDKYDDTDPMNLGTTNRNLFAWYAYEETARNIAFALNEALDLNLNL